HVPLPHPDLTSFPTRRSSDLAAKSHSYHCHYPGQMENKSSYYPKGCFGSLFVIFSKKPFNLKYIFFSEYCLIKTPGFKNTNCRRSEEHTSELQSLRHLVCRLL